MGLIWVCPTCRGRALTFEVLRHAVPQTLVDRLWQRARSGQYAMPRRCPACCRPTVEVPIIPAESKTTYLDVCTGCHFVWFDTQEFEELPKVPARLDAAAGLPVEAQEALAAAQLQILKGDSAFNEAVAAPDHPWQFALGMIGIPVVYNDIPLRNRPVVTWSLAALIAAVSLTAMTDLDGAVESWGLIPAEFWRWTQRTASAGALQQEAS